MESKDLQKIKKSAEDVAGYCQILENILTRKQPIPASLVKQLKDESDNLAFFVKALR